MIPLQHQILALLDAERSFPELCESLPGFRSKQITAALHVLQHLGKIHVVGKMPDREARSIWARKPVMTEHALLAAWPLPIYRGMA